MTGEAGRGLRVAALAFASILLAQAAWILAVPPFRGMDEFDHAYRAAGVASGQWRLHDQAPAGRGLLVDVPAGLVEAAQGQCEELAYIAPETCDGDGPGATRGTVRATTSAANYEPVFYWVVGTAGEPFGAAHSLYAMRAAAALMCALVLAIAVWCLTTWVRGSWTVVGLLVGLTPTLIYSTTIPAPNGLEMAAGLCLWVALLGLGGRLDQPDPAQLRRERWLLAAATLSVVLLAGLRTLGPIWAVVILLCVMAVRGPRPLLAAAGRHRLQVALGGGLAAGTCLAVLLWNRGNVAFPPGALNGDVDTNIGQAFRWLNWVLATIGAFPYRDQPAPIEVYVLVLLVVGTLVVAAVRRGAGAGRAAVVLATALFFLVPSVLVAVTLESRGGMWQARYSLPFTVGVLVVAGAVLDRVRWRSNPRDLRPQLLALLMLGAAQVASVVHVQAAELHRGVSAHDRGWLHPPTPGTGLLMALAWVLLGAVALRQGSLGSAGGPDPAEPTPGQSEAAAGANAR